MGYDMEVVRKDEEVEAKVAKIRAKIDELMREPLTDEVREDLNANYERLDAVNLNTFRLNIFGMGKMRDDMETLGMLTWGAEQPKYPDPADFGITDPDKLYDLTEEEQLELGGEFAEFARASQKYLMGSRGTEVIAGHKLCSNDGWIVTPLEIHNAIRALGAQPFEAIEKVRKGWPSGGGNLFDRWVIFLGHAMVQGGFRVY